VVLVNSNVFTIRMHTTLQHNDYTVSLGGYWKNVDILIYVLLEKTQPMNMAKSLFLLKIYKLYILCTNAYNKHTLRR
jgi:hypothetical protein